MKRLVPLLAVLLVTLSAVAGSHRAVQQPAGDSATTADILGVGSVSGSMVSGTVSSVQGTVLVLNSGSSTPIRIETASAKFASPKSATVSVADVHAGSRVTAFVTPPAVAAAGGLVAQLVTVDDQPDLTVTGPVQSVDAAAARITVLGVTFTADANTSFGTNFPTFAPIRGVGDIAPGQVVNIVGAFGTNGLLARKIQVLSPFQQPSQNLRGAVKSIAATAWVITTADGKDVNILVTGDTKINGDPKVGDQVQVMANVDSANNFVAIAIVKIGAIVSPPPVTSFKGTVKSIATATWVITTEGKDVTIGITSETKINGDPKVGDQVQVTTRADTANTVVAMTIVKVGATPSDSVELHGWVSSIGATEWTIGRPAGSMMPDTMVTVTSTTVIYPDPKVGDKVVVVGTRSSIGKLVALKIARETP